MEGDYTNNLPLSMPSRVVGEIAMLRQVRPASPGNLTPHSLPESHSSCKDDELSRHNPPMTWSRDSLSTRHDPSRFSSKTSPAWSRLASSRLGKQLSPPQAAR